MAAASSAGLSCSRRPFRNQWMELCCMSGGGGPGGVRPGKGEMEENLGGGEMPCLVNLTHKISGSGRDGRVGVWL